MKKRRALYLTQSAAIATIYIILTLLTNLFGLASGIIQFRLSEILTILPVVSQASIPGIFIGCFLSNLLTGCPLWDVILGSIATLIGAYGTRIIGKKNKYLAPLAPIVSNAVIVSLTYCFIYPLGDNFYIMAITVGIGEIVMCGIFGLILLKAVERYKIFDN